MLSSGPRKTGYCKLLNNGFKTVFSVYGRRRASFPQKAGSRMEETPKRGEVTCIASRKCTGQTGKFLIHVHKRFPKAPEEPFRHVVLSVIRIGLGETSDRR